jgi:serine phosphatase RsbU (regulator of sigma subunit)
VVVLALVLGWLTALAGPVASAWLTDGVDDPARWLPLGITVAVLVATLLAGALAGVASALVGAVLTWQQLEDHTSAHGDLAVAVGVGGATLALLVASMVELRRRERTRAHWLEGLGHLGEALADTSSAEDPLAVVEEAARRVCGATSVVIERAGADGGERVGLFDEGLRRPGGEEVDVPSSGSPPVLLRLRLPAPPPDSLASEHAAFLRGVADQCAAALERADLVRAEQQAQDDLELLARASTALSASLDLERVATTIQDLVVPYLADECTLAVASPSRPGLPAVSAQDEPPADCVIPLRDRGELIGELALSRRDRPLTDAERKAAMLVGEPASRALAHALLFSEQVRTSATLEHSLLPEATLAVDDLQIATRYLAATEGHAAGGDFYDVLRAPGGGAVLVVGDVQGKGVEAATLTSAARHTLRAAALAGATPGDMLNQLNRALLYGQAERLLASGEPQVRFVTASVVLLSPTDHGFDAVVGSAGHPPPLLIRPGGQVEQLVAEGPLLGVFDDPCYEEHVCELGLSDVLVLYTDGVTEQRQQPDLFDEAQLGRLVRNMLTARHAEAVAQHILDTVVVLSPREVRDDIALVVARVTGPR